mgnify:CR=1 FL=1
MAIDYDRLNAITQATITHSMADNLFNGGLTFTGLKVYHKPDPGKGWRKLFEKIDAMDREREKE